ncbi:dynactin, partial [Saccharata proteae CBS 121410]
GQVVKLRGAKVGTVRFVGETAFKEGQWVGIELGQPEGKNDGSVQGERYFSCEYKYGLFLRPSDVEQIMEEPKPKVAARPTPGATKGRPSSMDQGRPKVSATATPKLNRPASLSVDNKSPVAPATRSPTKRTSTIAPRPRPSASSSSGSTAATTRRSTITPATQKAPATPASSATRPPRASISTARTGSTRTGSTDNTVRATPRTSFAPSKRPSPPGTVSRTPSSPAVSTPPSAQRNFSNSMVEKDAQIQERDTKIRTLQQQFDDAKERLKDHDALQQECDRYKSITQKLQAKIQPQYQEILELRRLLKESEEKLGEIETIQAEHDEIMELATLDREMAEEQAEAYKAELETVKTKLEEVELEREILAAENEELGRDISPEEKTSQGWVQLDRENNRLREALLRLRDVTQETESQLREQIQELEDDVKGLSGVKEQYEETKARLLEAEAGIEDLRQQLDANNASEEMVEELAEKNMSLSEQVQQLRLAYQELEMLQEVSDELEINHIENEKQLQEEIDLKDSVLAEQIRRVNQQEETLSDQEYTIERFRELVTNLQSDIDDMKASKRISETEAHELNSRSRAMMDLNRQLQVSATNTKVKTIDMELRKLEAQEAAEHLAIVQLFLPEAFHSERESVLAMLRFKRIGFKANLLHNFVKDRVTAEGNKDEDIFETCDVLDNLTWISAMCDRFVNNISSSSLEQFARFEGALYELEPVERAMNRYIEDLKRDELKDKDVAQELHRSVAVMTHLAETLLSDSLESYADDVLMRSLLMQSHLEIVAAALAIVKTEVQSKVPANPEEDDGIERFTDKTESMIANSRSAKVVIGKSIRALNEHRVRSLSLQPETLSTFEECQDESAKLALYVRKLGANVFQLLQDEGRAEPFTLSEVRSTMFTTTDSVFQSSESDLYSTFGSRLRKLTDGLIELTNITSDLEMTVEFDRSPAPWVLRSKELQDSKIVSIDAEEEIRRLKEDIHERATQIKLQEQKHEEATVKIELLESRTRDASKKAQRITELEKAIEASKAREKQLAESVEQQVRDLAALESEKEKLEQQVAEAKTKEARTQSPTDKGGEKTVATKREIDALRSDIDMLEKANKYLRLTNKREMLAKDSASNAWLAAPLVPAKSAAASFAETMAAKSRAALRELTDLPNKAKYVNLSKVDEQQPKDRLAWRPLKSTPQWQIREQE